METMDSATFRKQFYGGGDPVKQPNRKVTKQDRASLEDAFLAAWRVVAKDLPEPARQWRFHMPRMWRFDFAWSKNATDTDCKVAVEIQGGGFVHGGHNRGAQQAKDHEKLNTAQADGWTVLQFGTKAMGDPYKVAAEVAEILRAKITKEPTHAH